jgi:hypothetical protein
MILLLAALASAGVGVTPASTLTGANTNDSLGTSVADAGDVNGDGVADLVVGARGYAGEAGGAFVHLGSPAGVVSDPFALLVGEGPQHFFGETVSGAGDVDGDGFDDLIVGAPGAGAAYVFHGGPDGVTLGARIPGDGGGFSTVVSRAGDVNADGFGDVLVGAPDADGAYLFLGSPAGIVVPPEPRRIDGPGGSSFGRSVAAAGDVNADGYDDVVVGANASAQVFVFHGGPDGLPAVPDTTFGDGAVANYALSVDGAGDVNGDGYDDVIVSAGARAEAVIHGGSPDGISATPLSTLSVPGCVYSFGERVSGAGDVNGDGFADVIVASPRYLTVHVCEGSAEGVSDVACTTLPGYASYAVSGAGDVDGDGFADVVHGDAAATGTGAPTAYGLSRAGLVFVHAGREEPGTDALADAPCGDVTTGGDGPGPTGGDTGSVGTAGSACGCASTRGGPGLAALASALVWVRRRHRRSSPHPRRS